MANKIVNGTVVTMSTADIEALSVGGVQSLVPTVVTMRQARLALLSQGLLSNVDIAIAALPEPDKSAAQIEWEYSQTVERNRPFVMTLGAALGLDDAALDALFILAETL
jgi:hypothetical protein